MYTDDMHVTYAGSNLENVQFCLNEDLASVFNWLQTNKLALNMTKTEFMLILGFHSRGQQPCFSTKTKEDVSIIIAFNSRGIGSGHQHGRHFIVWGHQHGGRDVM